MTTDEWTRIVNHLKTIYRYPDFLGDDLQKNTWFNSLNRYSYDWVRNAVIKYSEENRQTPTLADIVSYTRLEKRISEQENQPNYSKYKNCPACRNSGVIFFYYGKGNNRYTREDYDHQGERGITVYESCRPCFECNRLRDKMPEFYNEWLQSMNGGFNGN